MPKQVQNHWKPQCKQNRFALVHRLHKSTVNLVLLCLPSYYFLQAQKKRKLPDQLCTRKARLEFCCCLCLSVEHRHQFVRNLNPTLSRPFYLRIYWTHLFDQKGWLHTRQWRSRCSFLHPVFLCVYILQ